MHAAIWRKKNVVEASVDPGLMVFPAPVGIDVWCPRAGEPAPRTSWWWGVGHGPVLAVALHLSAPGSAPEGAYDHNLPREGNTLSEVTSVAYERL